jgi:ribonuclease M5
MIKIQEVIVVEGRYDKNTLSQVVDATIIELCGFGIFSDAEKLSLLRRMAETRGLVILTDSDGAGFVIRNYLRGALPKERVKHAYIPDVPGKEKRKSSPSREGKLGVEGMRPEILLEALRRAGATMDDAAEDFPHTAPITKADLFAAGLSGCADSATRRAALLRRLDLPEHLSPNALLDVLNALMTRGQFLELI